MSLSKDLGVKLKNGRPFLDGHALTVGHTVQTRVIPVFRPDPTIRYTVTRIDRAGRVRWKRAPLRCPTCDGTGEV